MLKNLYVLVYPELTIAHCQSIQPADKYHNLLQSSIPQIQQKSLENNQRVPLDLESDEKMYILRYHNYPLHFLSKAIT